MTARMRSYEPKRDFVRVRDFLVETYAAFPLPYNWGLERWNYARYFVAPMLGAYGTDQNAEEKGLAAIRFWEEKVRIWEDEAGRIAGVTCLEHPDLTHPGFGEFFVLRHPEHVGLLEEMVAVAEELYVDPGRNRVYVWTFEADADLNAVLEARRFARKEDSSATLLEFPLEEIPEPKLPEGYVLRSMADENDVEKRREIFGRSFNHEDPKDWPSAFAYRELQRAPDYELENDLVIVAPDGAYAACCIVWHDAANRIGFLEPLGTHPDHRRKGLAEQILREGMRRLRAKGATRMPMGGGFEPFYRAFGFEERAVERAWIKEF